ncbi:MAG: hypothetical protein KJ947_21705 [Alphaproteobacteria bacterium]|jgi:hypothetical protein|nr:hypothetical protein [Alphaproteobacteria bacterium]MBU1552163.1 hypothetical protein [Alphaproteobacteria bacterium]MBU2336927.1 hypothetical protein [Alphaproteobacteria bacterium]MBU2389684.1 hypothetical protein [Alphaproteobacteria bacterium]|tara:strand:+ start:127 stop:369 length:243 start_codon:yes stop_codon:yes gene_type:complete
MAKGVTTGLLARAKRNQPFPWPTDHKRESSVPGVGKARIKGRRNGEVAIRQRGVPLKVAASATRAFAPARALQEGLDKGN